MQIRAQGFRCTRAAVFNPLLRPRRAAFARDMPQLIAKDTSRRGEDTELGEIIRDVKRRAELVIASPGVVSSSLPVSSPRYRGWWVGAQLRTRQRRLAHCHGTGFPGYRFRSRFRASLPSVSWKLKVLRFLRPGTATGRQVEGEKAWLGGETDGQIYRSGPVSLNN